MTSFEVDCAPRPNNAMSIGFRQELRLSARPRDCEAVFYEASFRQARPVWNWGKLMQFAKAALRSGPNEHCAICSLQRHDGGPCVACRADACRKGGGQGAASADQRHEPLDSRRERRPGHAVERPPHRNGPVTHFASAMFWAVPFAAWYVWQRPRTFLHGFCGAAVLSAFAAFFGYRVISRPLTPGWERCRMCLWPRPSHPLRWDWQPAQGSRGRNREPAVTLLPGFPARIAELYRSYTGSSCHRQEQAMAKTQLQGPPIRKDGLQIDERRHFQEIFWTVERFAWIIFALILLLALLGLTGSGGYFAKTTQTLDAGTAEYARFSRWE